MILGAFSIPAFAQIPVTFSGTITDRDGTPAPNQQVVLSGSPLSFNGITDANGFFSVLAAPDTYSLGVNNAGSGLPANVPQNYNLNGPIIDLSEDVVQDFTLPNVFLDVTVQDPLGNPVSGVTVQVPCGTNTTFELFPGELVQGSSCGFEDTDEFGVVNLILFPGSPYTVDANPPAGSGFIEVLVTGVSVTQDNTLVITLNATPDNTPPDITLVGANPQIIKEGDAYTELGATATDNFDGDLTASIVIDASAVNTSLEGTYSVTYDVTDSSGNAAVQVTRTVQVITAAQATQQVVDEFQNIIDNNPGTPLADKVQGAQASAQTAINELNKTPPDNQAAAGNIEGAIGSLEDAIKDDGLDPVQGEQLINQLLDVSRQIAVNAINTANNTPGSDAGKISSANAAVVNGDLLRTPPTLFGDFKNAAAEYKAAIAEAEGALP